MFDVGPLEADKKGPVPREVVSVRVPDPALVKGFGCLLVKESQVNA